MAAECLATKMQLKQRIPMRPMSLVKAQNKPVVLSIALYRLLVKDERLRPFSFFDIFWGQTTKPNMASLPDIVQTILRLL